MNRSRAFFGVLCCAALAGGLGGCNSTASHSDAAGPAQTPRSVGLVAGDAIGRFSFADDQRIAWAPDLPWMASYHSVIEQHQRTTHQRTATVQVPDAHDDR